MEHREDLSFGAICIKLGFSTTDRIAECLQIQRRMKELGLQPKRVGEIMIEKHYLTPEQVGQIFWTQGIKGGHTEIGGYRILAKIGQGAMGSVYKAVQVKMERPVALKVLAPKFAQNRSFIERFFREARAVARFNHTNIIQGIDCGESNGVHYFVMEYVDGPTAMDLIRRERILPEKQALGIVLQIARGLEQAARVGLIHRDVKPQNIMITQDGVAKLCDLGLVKDLSRQPGHTPSETGMTLGTPDYISPEQARGDADVDTRSDIYSLGATLYHMLTGQLPFPGKSAIEVIQRHLNDDLVPVCDVNPAVSIDANFVTMKMMSKEREERYQTPTELVQDLELLVAGKRLPIFEEPEKPDEPQGGPNRPRTSRFAKGLPPRRRFRR